MSVEYLPYNPTTMVFNDNGKTVEIDLQHPILEGQTDTSLIADAINRLLQFSAERHTDTITAAELGAILHLADIGDVNTKGVTQGSILSYKQNNDCSEGCVGTHNVWEPWNAIDGQTDSAYYPMGFAQDGSPVSIAPPANPNKTYFLGWNGKNQLSYFTVTQATAAPAKGGQVYYDEETGQLVYLRSS